MHVSIRIRKTAICLVIPVRTSPACNRTETDSPVLIKFGIVDAH
jgi:hypothetical protein